MEPPSKKRAVSAVAWTDPREPLFCTKSAVYHATMETTCQATSPKILVKLLDGLCVLNLGERSVNERVGEQCLLEEPRVESLLTFGFRDSLCKLVDIIQLLS